YPCSCYLLRAQKTFQVVSVFSLNNKWETVNVWSPFVGCVSMPGSIKGGICGNCAWGIKRADECTCSARLL
ncbi:hypothetical protein QBC32DRAFT_179571, partial [Pseudoneurospora amorphoporcata]